MNINSFNYKYCIICNIILFIKVCILTFIIFALVNFLLENMHFIKSDNSYYINCLEQGIEVDICKQYTIDKLEVEKYGF